MKTPSVFNNLLRDRGLTHEIYEAMDSDDYADVVMATIKSLKKSLNFPTYQLGKNEMKSRKYREEGNIAFKLGHNNLALEYYNRALMHAPDKSREMVLAYSNRSAVLCLKEYFNECLADIETCNRLGSLPEIVDKLAKRKEWASSQCGHETTIMESVRSYCRSFVDIGNRNADVPCASADVDVVVKGGEATVTVVKDIKVGTVLAVETSFVGCNDPANTPFACHYCHKLSYNLIPCDGCCFVLFCNESCKRICVREYHGVECQIMGVVDNTICSPAARLMLKGALKFVHMCGSWETVIEESHVFGARRRRVSSASEMLDAGDKASVLSFDDDNLFVHGAMYAASFVCAAVIHNLDALPAYLPQCPRVRALAKCALARIMMYLAVFAKPTQVNVHQWTDRREGALTQSAPGHGLYSFIGKLRNSCTPNVVVTHLGNKAALIALVPLERGTELTFSHV